MAETVGIPAARDQRGQLHGRAAIDQKPDPPYAGHTPLLCASCSAKVYAKGTHLRRDTVVQAHYCIAPGSEHHSGCRYDFKNRALDLIRDSRGTIDRKQGHYRLLLPDQSEIEPLPELPVGRMAPPRARLSVTPSHRRLAESLGSAARIVRLLETFDHDPAAVDLFRAVYEGQVLHWADFCIDVRSSPLALGADLKVGLSSHPRAVHGIVESIGPARTGSTFQLRSTSKGYLDDWRTLRTVVRSKDGDVFRGIEAGHRWLGYGRWKLFLPESNPRYAEAQLWVDGPWSLTSWVP